MKRHKAKHLSACMRRKVFAGFLISLFTFYAINENQPSRLESVWSLSATRRVRARLKKLDTHKRTLRKAVTERYRIIEPLNRCNLSNGSIDSVAIRRNVRIRHAGRASTQTLLNRYA